MCLFTLLASYEQWPLKLARTICLHHCSSNQWSLIHCKNASSMLLSTGSVLPHPFTEITVPFWSSESSELFQWLRSRKNDWTRSLTRNFFTERETQERVSVMFITVSACQCFARTYPYIADFSVTKIVNCGSQTREWFKPKLLNHPQNAFKFNKSTLF